MAKINEGCVMQVKPPFPPAYAPLQTYVAGVNPQLWRLVVGMVLIFVIYIVASVFYFFLMAEFLDLIPTELASGSGPREVIVTLSSFLFLGLAVLIAALWPAKRTVPDLIGPLTAASRNFWRVLATMVPIIALAFAISLAFDPSFVPNLPFAQALPWLPLFLVVLFIQICAEELLFRGFIMGQLAARFASPIAWMILPSLLFGAVHYSPAIYGDAAWIVCAATAVAAVVFSDLTARTGNLGAASALHFGNNFLAMFLVGEQGRLNGLALFSTVTDLTAPTTILTQLLFAALMWLAARWALKV